MPNFATNCCLPRKPVDVVFFFFVLSVSPLLIGCQEEYGRTLFECPDSHYLSQFGASFQRAVKTRNYFFDCTPFAGEVDVSPEDCTASEETSTSNGDLYLSCAKQHYATGVSVVNNGTESFWSLLCCQSAAVSIRLADCVSTSFLNQFEEDFSFKSGRQIIHKWQALHNDQKRDRRWWLQICPIDIDVSAAAAPDENDVKAAVHRRTRFTRQAGGRFGRGRSRFFRFEASPQPLLTAQRVNQPSRLGNFARRRPNNAGDLAASPASTSATSSTTTTTVSQAAFVTASEGDDVTDAFDYYDYYDQDGNKIDDPAAYKKEQNSPVKTFIRSAKEIINNVQGGLILAQYALPNKNSADNGGVAGQGAPELLDPAGSGNRPVNSFSNSHDDDAAPVFKVARQEAIRQLPSPLPVTAAPPAEANKGALQNMLEFLGLCKGIAPEYQQKDVRTAG